MTNLLTVFLTIIGIAFTSIVNAQKEEIITLQTETCDIEGTLLVPETDTSIPIAIIIAGSGPTDRNCNNPMMTNNAYKLLAEKLAENNIASLRYDKRGVGKSSNNKIVESDLRFDHYIQDAIEWVNKMDTDTRFNEIIIIGHSEGSTIGMIVSQIESVDRFISVAGSGIPVDELLKEQLKSQPAGIYDLSAPIIDSLKQGHTVKNVPAQLSMLFRQSVQPYLISWMKIDPCKEISKIKKPVLIVQGTTDIQVDVKQAELLKEANESADLLLVEGMNHVLKDADADRFKNMATYNNPDLPLNSLFVSSVVSFINKE